jgi:polysaccharide export outer membrane protein
MAYVRTFRMIVLAGVACAAAGCFSSNPADIAAFLRPYQVDVTAEKYVLQPPDEVEIHCSKVPEIHLQRQRIRPDGKVTFEALGEVEAAGKTPEQLSNALTKKLAVLYTLVGEKPVEVRIAVYRSQVYYVLGEVTYAGPKTYTGRDTLLNALAAAGPTVLAWKERIQVIKPSWDQQTKAKIFEVNYDRMVAHGDISKDVLLEEGDIVFVPPTVLAAIAMKIEEFVRPIGRVFSTAYYVQRVDGGY